MPQCSFCVCSNIHTMSKYQRYSRSLVRLRKIVAVNPSVYEKCLDILSILYEYRRDTAYGIYQNLSTTHCPYQIKLQNRQTAHRRNSNNGCPTKYHTLKSEMDTTCVVVYMKPDIIVDIFLPLTFFLPLTLTIFKFLVLSFQLVFHFCVLLFLSFALLLEE